MLLDLAGVVALQAGNAVLSYRGLIGALMGLAAVGIFSWLLQRHLTARFRAAALAIAEQGELLRTTLASIGDGVITTDIEARVTNLNAVAESLTGWTAAEAAGQPLHVVFNIVNEASRQTVENPAARALRKGVVVGLANHTVLIAKDGSERPIDDSAAPIRRESGEVVGCVLVFRDVTERRRVEARVKAERDRVQLVADAVPALISYIDVDGRFQLNNRAYETWFGRPPGDFAGRHMREVLGEAAWSAIQPHVEAALAGRVVRYEAEVPYREGGTRWVLATYTPDRSDDGEVRGVVAHVTDITDRKRTEESVRASEALQTFLVKLADTLRPLSDPIEVQAEASRVLGEWLGAHRVAYFEVRGDHYVVERDYVDGVPTIAGNYPIDSFGPKLYAIYRSGSTAVGSDVQADPAVSASERAAFEGIQTRAYVGVPLIKGGVFVAGLAVHVAGPREWTAAEIAAVKETAERTWAAVERARAEQALRLSEERFRALFDTMDEGFCVVEMIFDSSGRAVDYRILEMNPAFEKHTGLKGVVGRSVRDFAPDLDEFWHETYGRVATTGEPARFVSQAKALEDRWFDVYAFRLGDADSRKVAILFNDISHNKRAEEQVRESELQFRTMADNISHLAWMARPDGHVFWYNKRWYDYTGTTLEQMQGWGWQSVHDPAEVGRVVEKIKAHFASGEPWEDTFPLRRHDGELRWHLSRMMPVRDKGRIILWFGTNTDITEQREADRRKDEFLATLAHELRNPLAPLRNGLHVMKIAKDNEAAVEQARGMMERQLGHMVRLIDDLMDLSRISRGMVELRRGRVDLLKIVRQALETSRPLIESSGHELTLDVPPEPVYVDADQTRLAQVLSNLLNNAAKYTERGGWVRLGVERQDGDAVVSVRDNGMGIPADMLPRVFDMFTQVDRSLERSQGGLGIGLSLVRRLVEMHGGSVEARSDGHGLGSEFIVRIPVVPPAQQSEEPQNGDSVHSPTCCRILVADDNLDAASSLAMLLGFLGNEVRTVNDGLEAVEAAAEFRPDVALLDIGMPKLNGYDTCRRIREQPWGQNMVLIALTGWGQEEDKRQSQQAGFDHHIVKPVDPAALEKLLTGLRQATGS